MANTTTTSRSISELLAKARSNALILGQFIERGKTSGGAGHFLAIPQTIRTPRYFSLEHASAAREVVASVLGDGPNRDFALALLERFPDALRAPQLVCALVLGLRAMDATLALTVRAIEQRTRLQRLLEETEIDVRLRELGQAVEYSPLNHSDRDLVDMLQRIDTRLRCLMASLVSEHGREAIAREYDATARARRVPSRYWWEYPSTLR